MQLRIVGMALFAALMLGSCIHTHGHPHGGPPGQTRAEIHVHGHGCGHVCLDGTWILGTGGHGRPSHAGKKKTH